MNKEQQEIIDLTQQLLDSIAEGDWDTYEKLCASDLSCFEPEAKNHQVFGMDFHKFYFDQLSHRLAIQTTISDPFVRMLSSNAAIISYVRLQQRMTSDGSPVTLRSEETRVWEKQQDQWKHVHLHRSSNG